MRIAAFTAAGVLFGACLGCLAALCLGYLLLEVAEMPMPLARIVPMAIIGSVAGGLLLGLLELRREWRAARSGNDADEHPT